MPKVPPINSMHFVLLNAISYSPIYLFVLIDIFENQKVNCSKKK